MQVFEQGAAANDTQYLPARHRTLPIPESVTPIANYPTKLRIFRTLASRYWQVRCYLRGKTYTQSLKTTNKSAAISQAKQFFRKLTQTVNKLKIETSISLEMRDEEVEIYGKPNCWDIGRG